MGDAALVFDPLDIDAIASAIARLWEDDELCAELVRRGRRVAEAYDWAETARTYRAHYRVLAGEQMSADDRGRVDETLGRSAA